MPLFLPKLKASGHLDQIHITIFNVGSRKVNVQQDNYGDGTWGIFAPNLSIYGFDADAEACEEANAELDTRQINWQEKHIPLGLSNVTGESTLYVTKAPMCSSLYRPNEDYLKRFAGLAELMDLDFTLEIETTTLNDFCQQEGIKEVDFLQIDVQGAERLVLEGAKNLLPSVLALQLEVEFSPLYIDQPLFADLDTVLRNQDFTMFDLLVRRIVHERSPVRSCDHPGRLLWGEAFYLRDLPFMADKTPKQLFKLACIADALEFVDYALELLEYLTLTYGDDPKYNFGDVIVETLAEIPDLAQGGVENLPLVRDLHHRRSPKQQPL